MKNLNTTTRVTATTATTATTNRRKQQANCTRQNIPRRTRHKYYYYCMCISILHSSCNCNRHHSHNHNPSSSGTDSNGRNENGHGYGNGSGYGNGNRFFAEAFAPVQESSSILNKNNKGHRNRRSAAASYSHASSHSRCRGLADASSVGAGAARCRCLSSSSSTSTASSSSFDSSKSLSAGSNDNNNENSNINSYNHKRKIDYYDKWGSFNQQASKGHDSFVMRMANQYHEEELELERERKKLQEQQQEGRGFGEQHEIHGLELDDNEESLLNKASLSSSSMVHERRLFMATLLATTSSSILQPTQPSNAFEKAYPVNLDFDNDDSTINLQSIRQERIATQKSQAKETKRELLSQPLLLRNKEDVISTVVWSGALWLLLGSRNNPLIKPLANVLYDEQSDSGKWVSDRNEGLFTPLPLLFSLLLGIIFLLLGYVTDRSLLLLSEGDSNVVLQLAGVALIGGASLELGRIASGEKMITREDMDREVLLAEEFREFAAKRLVVGGGGSVHRSEVIRAFRRYFAKYRVENDEYPLTDLEIERLLRTWNKREGNEEGLTSAGFLKGVKINEQAIIR